MTTDRMGISVSDIFLSYSSDDGERIRPLVNLLAEQGWTVWWDRMIAAGQSYDEVIEQAIESTKCVLVVWSATSVKSEWVKAEAAEGVSRGVMVPIRIDDVKIPFEFRRRQTIDVSLPPALKDPKVQALLGSIATLIEQSNDKRATVRIVAAPIEGSSPFEIDATVVEEDTYLVLSARTDEIEEQTDSPDNLLKSAGQFAPKAPGSVLVRETSPLQLLAIVHDFDSEPGWREQWICDALDGVFREADRRMLRAIAMPLLGTRHGSLDSRRFAEMLCEALQRIPLRYVSDIWLMVTPHVSRDALKPLADLNYDARF